jgi:uncharacterized membrane protein
MIRWLVRGGWAVAYLLLLPFYLPLAATFAIADWWRYKRHYPDFDGAMD